MKLGPITNEDVGSWCQVVDPAGRVWTIRARAVTIEKGEFYECWVNDVMLPIYWRRERQIDDESLLRVFAAGLQYIEGRYAAP